MREEYDFRIWEEHAPKLFSENEGVRLSALARRIKIDGLSPKFLDIGKLDRELKSQGAGSFFASWNVVRRYTQAELQKTQIFELSPLAYFEPCGEECGTVYDESTACPHCGAGAKQVGALFLSLSRIPKKPDIATTIAREIVVNQRFVDVFRENDITGVGFHPVRQKKMTDLTPTGWYQFVVGNVPVSIVSPTRIGIDPFDEDAKGEYRCPYGDTLGLNLLSEITIASMPSPEVDVFQSLQFVGRRQGLLRQSRSIFVTPKVRSVIESNKLKGIRFEVVHVDSVSTNLK